MNFTSQFRRAILLLFFLALNLMGCDSKVSTPLPTLTQTALAAIAQVLWNNPLPKTVGIDHIIVSTSTNPNLPLRLCVVLNTRQIWEPGEYGGDTYLTIYKTAQIEIDSLPVTQDKLEISDLTILMAERDLKGNVIGSHGGETSICFKLTDIVDGIHSAAIQLQSKSGKPYGYKWAFQITREGDKISAILPAAISN